MPVDPKGSEATGRDVRLQGVGEPWDPVSNDQRVGVLEAVSVKPLGGSI